jgi:UDP-glucose 4-epimerase
LYFLKADTACNLVRLSKNKKRVAVKSKTTLLIGGGGFIGSAIANFLVETNNTNNIVVVGRSEEPRNSLDPRIKYERINADGKAKLELLIRCANVIIDLAGENYPAATELEPSELIKSHVLPAAERMYIASQSAVEKYIYLSSGGAIYGRVNKLPINEDAALDPISQYGLQKLFCEQYAKFLKLTKDFPVIIVRPSNPYGLGQIGRSPQGFIGVTISAILDRRAVQIFGKNGTIRDYLYISDLVNAMNLLIESDIKNGIYNLGTGVGYSNVQIMKIISSVMIPLGHKIVVEHLDHRENDVPSNVLDVTKAQADFNWRPTVDIREGVKRTIFNFLQNIEVKFHI